MLMDAALTCHIAAGAVACSLFCVLLGCCDGWRVTLYGGCFDVLLLDKLAQDFQRVISRVGLVVLCHALETSLIFDLVLDATIHSTGRHLAIPNVSPVPAVRPYNSCECSCVSSLQLTLPSFGFSVRSYNLLCVLILCVEMPVAMFPGLRTNGSCCLCCSGWVPCLWYLVVLALKVLAVWGCLLVLRSLVRTLVVCLVSVLCPLSFGFC